MIAGEFFQVEGVDFFETYAPVVKLTSIRVLGIVVKFNLYLYQMDVVTAFLNEKLDEEIYTEQPEGYESGSPKNTTCRHVRSLYRLKQALRQWNQEINKFFCKELGITRNTADLYIYVKHKEQYRLVVALYVDDLLACSS